MEANDSVKTPYISHCLEIHRKFDNIIIIWYNFGLHRFEECPGLQRSNMCTCTYKQYFHEETLEHPHFVPETYAASLHANEKSIVIDIHVLCNLLLHT